jgi:hypothetical protein
MKNSVGNCCWVVLVNKSLNELLFDIIVAISFGLVQQGTKKIAINLRPAVFYWFDD